MICRRKIYAPTMLALLALWPLQVAAEKYRDQAAVIGVEPIVEREYHTLMRRVCEPESVSALAIADSIGEDVRQQARHWARDADCRVLPQRQYRERVTGYWVTYRYGGVTATRRMARDPGKRLPVNVRLSPRP